MAARNLFASLLIAVALAAPANAQLPCDQLQRIIAVAPEHFRPLWGEEIEPEVYVATQRLGDAMGCEVRDVVDSVYICLWEHPSRDAAKAAFRLHETATRPCLAGWKSVPYPAGEILSGDRVMHTEGAIFERTLGSTEVSVSFWTYETVDRGAKSHGVAYEVRRWAE